MLLPLQGALSRMLFTQGDALGYVLVAPLGRIAHNYCGSYFLHITKSIFTVKKLSEETLCDNLFQNNFAQDDILGTTVGFQKLRIHCFFF